MGFPVLAMGVVVWTLVSEIRESSIRGPHLVYDVTIGAFMLVSILLYVAAGWRQKKPAAPDEPPHNEKGKESGK